MKVVRTLEDMKAFTTGLVMGIGFFDGVHHGHRKVIGLCREEAARDGYEAWAMTFEPHPLKVIQPSLSPPLLTTLPAKLDLLDRAGVHGCLVTPFTKDFSMLDPKAFLDRLRENIPGLKGIVIGSNWRFGSQARGDVALLKEWADHHALSLTVAEPVIWSGQPVSSTRIREAVLTGRLEDAEAMLGRPHAVRGIVVPGLKRGRHLGFPTANLELHGDALPPAGIYAAVVVHHGLRRPGALYMPAPPNEHPGLLEVHLLDYDGDLYGEELNVEFIRRIREDNLRFDKQQDLVRQIQSDVDAIRALLEDRA